MVELTEHQKNAIFEQNFPCRGMTREERSICLNIIKHCKEISDSEHKVDGQNKCEILQMSFEKFKERKNVFVINGTLSIGLKNKEARCIDGVIYLEKNSILVDMHIVRVCTDTLFNEYSVVDEFKIVKDELKRKSYYDYDMKKMTTKIDNEELKGKIK